MVNHMIGNYILYYVTSSGRESSVRFFVSGVTYTVESFVEEFLRDHPGYVADRVVAE